MGNRPTEIQVHDKTFRPLISSVEIESMVNSVAAQINADFSGQELTAIVIL